MTEQDDPLDTMALMLTEGFRKFITHYRASGMSGKVEEGANGGFRAVPAAPPPNRPIIGVH